MDNLRSVVQDVAEFAQSEQFEQLAMDASDFLSARERGDGSSVGTQIAQMSTSLEEAAEVLHRSFQKRDEEGRHTNVISPVVMPKGLRSYALILGIPVLLALFGAFGLFFSSGVDSLVGTGFSRAFFGPHYWLLLLGYMAYSVFRHRYVMIPDGCQALITKFGKVEETVGPGRKRLLHPRRKVGYIVNTTKEYPYNAPIRQAPTEGRVDASVDLFLQFRIQDPSEFIFTLGGVNGFSEKLHHAISEVTRALIYEQKAEAIYDLVGESTQGMLDSLNRQFEPAVRFVSANITHAEPASQEYRMDLAAAELVKVAKEAYTYQYELELRKSQDEGELNKELAELRQQHSEIQAEVATYQAQIDTAREKAINKANVYARQLMIEARSEAKANAALLEAQALDIRTVNSAYYPEILEYRYQQEVLEKITAVAKQLPQLINVGKTADNNVDFMGIARQMMGIEDKPLYTSADITAIRKRAKDITSRIKERATQIERLDEDKALATESTLPVEVAAELLTPMQTGDDAPAPGVEEEIQGDSQ